MTTKPERLEWSHVQAMSGAAVWTIPEVAEAIAASLSAPLVEPLSDPGPQVEALIAVGGGGLLDESKSWRKHHRPDLQLIAVPTLWGSGAEVSPIAVLNREGKKQIELDPALLPDAVSYWPGALDGLPEELAVYGCGDTWAHALEGFLSPLASEELRQELAGLLQSLLEAPIGKHFSWFELSAQACAGQARSSVGLIHGIAHTLEGVLADDAPGWGHARLCSALLYPVMRFNAEHSDKWGLLMEQHQLDGDAILEHLRACFFDAAGYATLQGQLEAHWRTVLRDPCSRTNSVLVRPKQLAYFQGDFQ